VLFDSPLGRDLPMADGTLESTVRYFASQFADAESLSAELDRRAGVDDQIDWLFHRLQRRNDLPDVMDLGYWRRLVHEFAANLDALLRYEPGPYPGALLYFRAAQRRPGYDSERPETPWLDLAAAGVRFHVVPGDHLSMFAAPHVDRLLAALMPYLQEREQALPNGGQRPDARESSDDCTAPGA
jgi:thioesterase domain-containing protein